MNPADDQDETDLPTPEWLPGPPAAGLVAGAGARRLYHLALLAAVALAIGAGWWLGSRQPVSQPLVMPTAESATTTTSGTVVVHVAGWVAHPGIVRLGAGSRVVDAVAAAGGVAPGGSLEGINLAEQVVDGGRVEVPGPDDPPNTGQAGGKDKDAPLRLNTAQASDLETLPGVGPVLAMRIIEHRESNGPFETVEDLLDVPGIGEATLDELRPHLTVP